MGEKKEASQDFQQLGIDFQNSLKEFIEKTESLSKKSLIRMSKALAAHPLEENIVTLIHPDEIEAYEVGKVIQSLKLNMMIESLKQDAIEEQNILTQNKEN